MLVNSLLYGTRARLVLNLPTSENKKYTAYDRFHGNGPRRNPDQERTNQNPRIYLKTTLPYNNNLLCDPFCFCHFAYLLNTRIFFAIFLYNWM